MKDLKNFEEMSEDEKINTLKRLHRKAAENDGEMIDDMELEGEVTVRVLDEDGDEKQVEKKNITR